MGYYKASSIVERKDLHRRLEEIKTIIQTGSMQLPPGSLSRISESRKKKYCGTQAMGNR